MSEFTTLSDAITRFVRPGHQVALEGFTHLIPFAAGHEIIRQRITDLTLIRMTPDLLYDQMIGSGCARKLVFSWGGNPGVGSLHRFRDAVERGWPRPLEIEEHSHSAMAHAYAAGAAGPCAVFRGYRRNGPREGESEHQVHGCPRAREQRHLLCRDWASSAACNLARLTHAPRLTLVYESGTLETKPTVLPLSIGDGELCETALTTVSVPEMFQYWLQGGRISVGFLGGAQIDRFGNLNSTVIGPYAKPKVRLPGSGGATEIATGCQRIYVVMRHNTRTFAGTSISPPTSPRHPPPIVASSKR